MEGGLLTHAMEAQYCGCIIEGGLLTQYLLLVGRDRLGMRESDDRTVSGIRNIEENSKSISFESKQPFDKGI